MSQLTWTGTICGPCEPLDYRHGFWVNVYVNPSWSYAPIWYGVKRNTREECADPWNWGGSGIDAPAYRIHVKPKKIHIELKGLS